MKDSSSPQQPYMIFETNPDGYGPFFPSFVYKMKENSDGTIYIVSREDISDESEYVSDANVLIVVQPIDSKNSNSYSWRFDFKKGDLDYQKTFDQILSTFKFTN